MAILAFNQVTFTDKDHTILKEISFSIEQGGCNDCRSFRWRKIDLVKISELSH